MATNIKIGISTRALFDLELENNIYEEQGIEAYIKYQIEHENDIIKPGAGFKLIKKISELNKRPEMADSKIEVVIMSRCCPDIAIRVFNSIKYYELDIISGVFTGGAPLADYVKLSNTDLYLSSNEYDVKQVIDAGIAAGLVVMNNGDYTDDNNDLRIAFDCDRVIFSDESDKIFEEKGMEAYLESEEKQKNKPIGAGPFKNILLKLGDIQSKFEYDNSPVKLAICTARGCPTHERAIKTLRSWNVRVNQAFFLSGQNKSKVLQGFKADIFFDDKLENVIYASEVVPSFRVLG